MPVSSMPMTSGAGLEDREAAEQLRRRRNDLERRRASAARVTWVLLAAAFATFLLACTEAAGDDPEEAFVLAWLALGALFLLLGAVARLGSFVADCVLDSLPRA